MKKIAVITGASSGMGKEFALKISKNFKSINEIWLIARRADRLEEVREEIDMPSYVICEDISEEYFIDKFAKMLKQENVKIKMLINCAGYGLCGKVGTAACYAELGMIDTNCRGLTAVTLAALPYMAKNSRIINVASSAAFMPQPYFAIYAATKSYVLSFSRALRREIKDKDVFVTTVCPGPVNTEFFAIADDGRERAWFKELTMAQADEVVVQALNDAINKKEMSVYGMSMKMFRIFAKTVPHKIILDVYAMMCKKMYEE